MEDLLYESDPVRQCAGLKLTGPLPDETPLLKFRRLLEQRHLGPGLQKEINAHLQRVAFRFRWFLCMVAWMDGILQVQRIPGFRLSPSTGTGRGARATGQRRERRTGDGAAIDNGGQSRTQRDHVNGTLPNVASCRPQLASGGVFRNSAWPAFCFAYPGTAGGEKRGGVGFLRHRQPGAT